MLASDVPAYAERLAPFLLNFAEHSHKRATALQLLDQIMSEHMQVYVVDDFKAVCLTTVHPGHIEINCCAGEDRTDWQDDLEAHIAEWAKATGEGEDEEGKIVHKDSNGNLLFDGDSVVLIKDLDVKGANFTAKRGAAVHNIKVVWDNAEQIEGRVENQHIYILTQYVKKTK